MGHGRQQGSIPKASISAAAIEPPASRFPGRFVPNKISARYCLNSSRPRGEPRAAGHRMLEGAAPREELPLYFEPALMTCYFAAWLRRFSYIDLHMVSCILY